MTYTVWITSLTDQSNYIGIYKNKSDADAYAAVNSGVIVSEGRISQAWFVNLAAVPLS